MVVVVVVVVVLPWMIWMKEETETDGPLLIELFCFGTC